MLTALLGKKIGMTQVYDDAGVLHPVTVVQAGPCPVLQVKTVESDGYDAVQLGFGDVKAHRATRPLIGHAKKAGVKPQKFVREVRLDAPDQDIAPGQRITVDIFDGIYFVDVIGTSKGKGFAGVMKRYNFGGQGASHGVERKHRSIGSIASHGTNAGTGPKPKKGKRMSGHMGMDKTTSRNHRLINIDKENNLLLIKGAVPGPNGTFVQVRVSTTAKANAKARIQAEEKAEAAAKAAADKAEAIAKAATDKAEAAAKTAADKIEAEAEVEDNVEPKTDAKDAE
jgi:large subunit ribosomal protein L3